MSTKFRIEVGMQSGRVFDSRTYDDPADVVIDSAAIFDGDKAGTSYVTLLDGTVVAVRSALVEWVRAYKVAAQTGDEDVTALTTTVRDAAAVRAVEAAARV